MDTFELDKRVIMIARRLVADYDYKYDPYHKNHPRGVGWKETCKGWSKNDANPKTKKDLDLPNTNSWDSIQPCHGGNVNAPVRKAIMNFRKNFFPKIPDSVMKKLEDNQKAFNTSQNELREQKASFRRFKASYEWSKLKPRERWFQQENMRMMAERWTQKDLQKLQASNLLALGIPKERQGKFKVELFKSSENEVNDSIRKGIAVMENFVDKSMIPDCKLTFRTRNGKKSRSDYEDYEKCITLYGEDRYNISIMVHEMGHFIEKNTPGTAKLCKEFLYARTAGEKPQSLWELTGLDYSESEKCRPDHFFNPYCGKIYKYGGSEILSMGIEKLATDPIGFSEQDSEYLSLVLGIVRGKIKKEN